MIIIITKIYTGTLSGRVEEYVGIGNVVIAGLIEINGMYIGVSGFIGVGGVYVEI